MANRREYAFDGIRRSQVIPMLGREVEEGQQCFTILRQAVNRLVMFRLVFLGEDIDRYLGQSAARRQVNFAQILLHVRLHRQRDLVQHVRGLMHPAALMRRSGKDLVESLPEAERTVANGDFRGDLQSPSFHIDQQFAPALRAFPNANLETGEFLLALRRSPDQHQHAFAVVFHASLQESAASPSGPRSATRRRRARWTTSIASSTRRAQMRWGSRILPMSRPGPVLSMTPLSSTSMRDASSAGGPHEPRMRASFSMRSRRLSMTGGRRIVAGSCITATEAANTSRSSIPSAWRKQALSRRSAVLAIVTTMPSRKPSMASTRPRLSIGGDRGGPWKPSSSQRSNGWTGSTIAGCWSLSATSRRLKPRNATTP